ncbi:ATPase [Gallibacterium salpingitidis]|uniref:ATPase n=1 Tax=Gallibacterium salpingitidis TaxID=505341 RepID=A0AB36E0Y4_9PAST|nr:ATP-binding protein [Gallibacterium salpingitidis]OBX08897.1 ATPase [Gallibacterium salpingitidis]WKS99416.1 ATP-binding protein [Gallibacterium salpingitidis]
MIKRPNYLNQLKPFINMPVIKVITGIRRSGKSTVIKLLQEELLKQGIDAEQIIYINFESFVFNDFKTADKLYALVKEKIQTTRKYYLLLDEIQEVTDWEKAINAFIVDFDLDLYITGSNSYLLSSELATYIAGRYVEIPVFTLSYREFLDFKASYSQQKSAQNSITLFNEYLRKGGFPMVHIADYESETVYKIVQDIYASVILRDTIQRHKIRDVELLERIIKYAFDNIGNTFSGKNVADYFKSQQRKLDLNTVYNYLKALESAFILHRVERFDIKGKEILKTQEKFYLGDVSLLYAAMGFRTSLIAGILENLVYLELKRRGYQVYIGKLDKQEIDFVAQKKSEKIYIQVAYKLESEQTIQREFSPLQAIADNYPKYVVTMDDFWQDNIDGIVHQHIGEFLLGDDDAFNRNEFI